MSGVAFLIPVLNGERHLRRVLEAALAELGDRAGQVLVVDDGSRDGSRAVAEALAAAGAPVRVVDGPGRGACAALNRGLEQLREPLVAQLDQDVIVEPGWLATLSGSLERDPGLAAAQGHYLAEGQDGLWARVQALDLRQRWGGAEERPSDHVCTGNTLYRREALLAVGGFDEALGYGYDNDLSYRLGDAGWRLLIQPAARSRHRMSGGLGDYLRRQFGYGYGRLDLIAKHPGRRRGDRVSGLGMIAHAGLTFLSCLALLVTAPAALAGWAPPWLPALCAAPLPLLALERLAAGVGAAWRFREPVALAFPLAHLLRDLAWAWAIARWGLRRLGGQTSQPGHSMPRGEQAPGQAPRSP